MRTRCLYWAALAGALFGTNLLAQPPSLVSTATPISTQQTMTTGMVGFTLNQTARLSVLNLNPVPATTNAPANCNVEMRFLDTKNNLLKHSLVMNFAPQTATSLDLTVAAVSSITGQTALRSQIRGAVIINPPTPSASPVAPGYCSVMVTLEIFDTTTGNTVALTTDTRMIGTSGIVPLMIQ